MSSEGIPDSVARLKDTVAEAEGQLVDVHLKERLQQFVIRFCEHVESTCNGAKPPPRS